MPIKQTEHRRKNGGLKPKSPNNPNPDPNSKRSKKRKARGFKSLELSSRKHKRAERRLAISQTIAGKRYPAGTPVDGAYSQDDFTYHSGGARKYHATK